MLEETLAKQPIRICSYCLMPNHRHVVGEGHLYQGRYKSFPVETDEYFYQVARYVERNPLRANLVRRSEEWRWSSLWRRTFGTAEQQSLLSEWRLPSSTTWTAHVNQPQTEKEVAAIRRSVLRGQPFGSADWVDRTAKCLGLESTLRARGRPRKSDE